jgi:prepilin signal peptidase PulO-like enzyme (type II secretory pathway)
MESILLFIFGLIIGSFLNVVSFRYDPEKGVFDLKNLLGRSHCPGCGSTLRWYELVPVLSFIIQLGKCRTCGMRISWQYPMVELASGFSFLLPLYLHNPIAGAVWVIVFLTFILIWSVDYRLYLIPDELNIILAICGAALIYLNSGRFGEFQGSYIGSYAALFGLRQNILVNHLTGALLGISIVGLIIILSRGKGMGMGDLKLMGALGLIFGWPDVLFLFMFGSVVGALVSVFLMLLKKKTMKSFVPFGPFLVLGAVLLFFFGEAILRNYFDIFRLV